MRPAVLLVEDEPLIHRVLMSMLLRQGIHVEATGDGLEALALIRSGRFAVVLLDLMLPRLSGYEIVRACAASLPAPHPVVLVMTAADGGVRRDLDPRFVTAVFTKPFDFALVAEIIHETLQAWTAVPAAANSHSGDRHALPPGA